MVIMTELVIEKEVNINEDIIIPSSELKKINSKKGTQKYKIIIIPEVNISNNNKKNKISDLERQKALHNIMRLSESSKLKLINEEVTREDAHKRDDLEL